MFLEQNKTYQLIINPHCKVCLKAKNYSEYVVKNIDGKYFKFCKKCNLLTENVLNPKFK